MNVNLVYLNNGFNFDVYQSSPLSYFYEIACKVFQLNKKMILLYYLGTKLPERDDISVSSFFKEELPSISITVQLVSVELPLLNSNSLNLTSPQNKTKKAHLLSQLTTSSTLKSTKAKASKRKKIKKKKEILCQICGSRPSLYYCRKCNEFVCLECNTKYSEHIRHDLLEVENGNYEQCACVYEKEVLNQISVIQTAFRKTKEWNNLEKIRTDFLNEFITKLQEIDANAQKIASSKINKNFELTEQTFYTLKQHIFGLLSGENLDKNKELQQVFSEYNKKEKEMSKLISYVSLEVTKAKYNNKLITLFFNIQSLLDKLVSTSIEAFNNCSLRSYLLEDLSSFNDDYPMKSLEHFLSQKTSNTSNESDVLMTLSNDFKHNANDKPLFTNYTRRLAPSINAELSININDLNSNKKNGENIMLLSPPQSTTSSMIINEGKIQLQRKNNYQLKKKISRNESIIPDRSSNNIKRQESNSFEPSNKNETFSPRKSIFKVFFGGSNNSNKLDSDELINSAKINPFSGNPLFKKKKTKHKFDSDHII